MRYGQQTLDAFPTHLCRYLEIQIGIFKIRLMYIHYVGMLKKIRNSPLAHELELVKNVLLFSYIKFSQLFYTLQDYSCNVRSDLY